VKDSGKWDGQDACGTEALSVVNAPSGFPAGKALRVAYSGESCSEVQIDDLPVPGNGQAIWYRLYVRSELTGNAGDAGHHPVQFAPGSCAFEWAWKWGAPGFRDWQVSFQRTSGSNNEWGTPLQGSTTYRMEWMLRRVSGNSWDFQMRVYNAAGNLIAAQNNNQRVSIDANCVRRLMVGVNGPTGFGGVSGSVYYGAVAVSTEGWIGEY
jgi:hypothetical protein